MPGLTAPSNYAEEPPRHLALRVNSKVRSYMPKFSSALLFGRAGGFGMGAGLGDSGSLIARIRGAGRAGWIHARA